MQTIIAEIERPDLKLQERAAKFSAATLHEAAKKRGALPSMIKPLDPAMRICGPAVTVSSPPGDNIMLHEALRIAKPGDVIVAEVSGAYEHGYWGDIMTVAAQVRNIQGLVIDGCVRDGKEIVESGFSVFARGLCIRGTSKNGGGTVNHPIKIADIVIHPGDLVVGDGDGVVVIPCEEIAEVLDAAEKREEDERRIREELKKGRTTMEIYGWTGK